MTTVIVSIPDNKEEYFLSLLKKNRFKSRVLSDEEKEDRALLALMNDGMTKKLVLSETTYRILDKIIKK